MRYSDPELFLDAVFNTIREHIRENKQQHPEDIMCAVTMITETIYQFVSKLPAGVEIVKSS